MFINDNTHCPLFSASVHSRSSPGILPLHGTDRRLPSNRTGCSPEIIVSVVDCILVVGYIIKASSIGRSVGRRTSSMSVERTEAIDCNDEYEDDYSIPSFKGLSPFTSIIISMIHCKHLKLSESQHIPWRKELNRLATSRSLLVNANPLEARSASGERPEWETR